MSLTPKVVNPEAKGRPELRGWHRFSNRCGAAAGSDCLGGNCADGTNTSHQWHFEHQGHTPKAYNPRSPGSPGASRRAHPG